MNDNLMRQLIADRQTAFMASAHRRAQIREALGTRGATAGDRPLPRVRVLRFSVRHAARTTA